MPILSETLQIPIEAIDKVTASVNKINSSIKSLDDKTNASSQRRNDAIQKETAAYQQQQQRIQNLKAAYVQLGAAVAIVGVAGKKLYEFGKAGAQLEFTQIKFDRLSRSVGTMGNVFLKDLRTATRGTVSDFNLMKNGTDLLQLGLAKTSQEAIRLSKVQTALGMDTGELTLALANQSKRRLDQLGLSLTTFNRIEDELKKKGYTKTAAFTEAFMLTAEQTIATTGNMADSNLGSFQRLEAAGANLLDATKVATAQKLAPIAEDVAMFLTGYRELMSGQRVMDWGAVFRGEDSWVRQGGVQDQSSLWSGGGRIRANMRPDEAILGLSAAQNYTAMAYTYGGGAGGPQSAAPEIDYDMLFAGAMKLSAANEQYSNVLSQVNEKLAAARGEYERLKSEGYDATSDKMREQMGVIQELTAVQQEATTAQVESSHDFIQAILEQQGASSQMRLDYAQASGQITQEAYNQQNALMAIADAFNEGRISAEQAAGMAEQVISALDGLDGKEVTAYINLVAAGAGYDILTNSGQGGGQTVITSPHAPGSAIQMHASGGAFSGWGVTGDSRTGLTPYSELVYAPHGAYVYNATQTRQMLGGMGGVGRYPTGGAIPSLDGEVIGIPNLGGGGFTPPTRGGISGSRAGVDASTVAANLSAAVDAIAAPVVAGVAQQATAQIQAVNMLASTIAVRTNETNALLRELIAKTASENGIARSVLGVGNKWNG